MKIAIVPQSPLFLCGAAYKRDGATPGETVMLKVSRLSNVHISTASDSEKFEIDKQGLWNILYAALANTNYDNNYYVKSNEDVREGIKRGEISSGFDHFVKFGFLEGRRGWHLKVDEHFYLAECRRPSVDQ